MSAPSRVYDLAVALLAEADAALTEAGVMPPSRQYVTTGTPLGACDALVVSWVNVVTGVVGLGETPALLTLASPRTTTLLLTLFRCGYPTLEGSGYGAIVEPAPDAYDTYASTVMTDAYVLHRGLQRANSGGAFLDWCTKLSLGAATPLEPQGGMAGVNLLVTVELD